jgi:solute carrier family 6 amino acid/orphan transporter-like 15/16/17/18/20
MFFFQALAQLPGAHFWAILFFLMMFFLGLDSQFAQERIQ